MTTAPAVLPEPRPRQVYLSRLAYSRAFLTRIAVPWKFCRVCGEPLARATYGRSCTSCHSWATRVIRAAESIRVRRLFADL